MFTIFVLLFVVPGVLLIVKSLPPRIDGILLSQVKLENGEPIVSPPRAHRGRLITGLIFLGIGLFFGLVGQGPWY